MADELNPAPASVSDIAPAAVSDTAAAASPSTDAAGTLPDRSTEAAASGDANADIRRLDQELDENVLKAREPDETPEPVKSEPETSTDDVLDEAVEEPEEADLLTEQSAPRTLEDFNKLYPRAPIPVREELARIEAETWKQKAEIDSIGGTVGIEIAKVIVPALLNANPGEKEANDTFQTLTDTNPALALGMSRSLLFHAIEEETIDPATGLPTNIATGNALIQSRWEGYDVEKLDKLVKYDQAGLLDHEELEKEAQLYASASPQILKELEETKGRLAAIEDRDKATQAKAQTDARAEEQKHLDRATDHVSKQVMAAVIPIAEHYGWTATTEELNSKDPAVKQLAESKIAMGKMLTAYMNSEMKKLPEWSAVEHLGKTKQAFTKDGQLRHIFTDNSGRLVTKLLADFKAMVRILNPTFAKSFGSTRAAKLKETTRSGQAETQIPAVKKTEENGKKGDFNAAIAELDSDYDKTIKQARA